MENKKNRSNLSLKIGIIILFIFAFIILISKQKENDNLGDIIDNEFYIHTIPSKQLVVRDLSAIYPKYYVFYFNGTDNTYIVYSFNYYQTSSQYELELYNHFKNIVDYDENEYMIRYIFDKGKGSYYDLLDEIPVIIDSNSYKIY